VALDREPAVEVEFDAVEQAVAGREVFLEVLDPQNRFLAG
jgi:hypothetical protein